MRIALLLMFAGSLWGQGPLPSPVAAAGVGSGTVTSVTIAGTTNQITATGTCTGTTTITCTLSIPSGFVLPGTIDGLTITTTTGTFTLASGKTLTVNKTVTLDGTDGVTITFPATNATMARTDAAQAFTGVQTFNSPIVGSVTGNAATATALAGNGTNCSAGQFPLGVDASGNSESCTAVGTLGTGVNGGSIPTSQAVVGTNSLGQIIAGGTPLTGILSEVSWQFIYRAETLSLAQGATVSTWTDISGNGRDATTTGGTPLMNNLTINGKPAVHFDGSSWMSFTGTSMNKQGSTVCAVMENNARVGTYVWLNLGAGSTLPYYQVDVTAGLYANVQDTTLNGPNTFASIGTTPGQIHPICYVMSAGAVTIYRPDSVWAGSALSSGTLSGGQIASFNPAGQFEYVGNIYELDGTNNALSATQVNEFFNYATAKYQTQKQASPLFANIVDTGDSITSGANSTYERSAINQSFPIGKLGQFVPIERNFGLSGQTMQAVAAGSVADITASYDANYELNLITISYGFNDIFANSRTAVQVETDLGTYVAAIKGAQSGWKIAVATITPDNTTGCTNDSVRNTYNSWLTGALPANVDFVINYTTDSLFNTCQNSNATYFTGLHPTDAGYARMARMRRTAIDNYLSAH